jgi:hypothetical protein
MLATDASICSQDIRAPFHIGIAVGCGVMFLALIYVFCDVLNVAILSGERNPANVLCFS